MRTKGGVRIPSGPTVMTLSFDDGESWSCPFEAHHGATVRWVGDAISVDDGDPVACTTIASNDGAP